MAISITKLADQFLAFVQGAGRRRFGLAADYLVMAAWLAYLKSRLLLPKTESQGRRGPVGGGDRAAPGLPPRAARRGARAAEPPASAGASWGATSSPGAIPEATTVVSLDADRGRHLRPDARLRRAARCGEAERSYTPPTLTAWRLDDAREHLRRAMPALSGWTSMSGVAPPGGSRRRPRRASLHRLDPLRGAGVRARGRAGREAGAALRRHLPESPRAGLMSDPLDTSSGWWRPCCSPPPSRSPSDDLRFRLPGGADVEAAISALAMRYSDRGVRLAKVGDRWRFETAADLAFLMTVERETPRRLSKAAQETLAIIAYHQPVTRAEIEEIRGVQTSRGSLDVLLELGFIRMRGRRRTPGRPVTWGTTQTFLEHYGLAGLNDLPGAAEMAAAGMLSAKAAADLDMPAPGDSLEDEDPLEENHGGVPPRLPRGRDLMDWRLALAATGGRRHRLLRPLRPHAGTAADQHRAALGHRPHQRRRVVRHRRGGRRGDAGKPVGPAGRVARVHDGGRVRRLHHLLRLQPADLQPPARGGDGEGDGQCRGVGRPLRPRHSRG